MGYIKDVKIGNDTHLIEPVLCGRCSTSSSTAVKVVDIPNFELVEGVRIAVYFVNPNTASSPKLNVNNTGEKTISYRTSRESNSSAQVTTATLPVLSGIQYFMYYTNSWQLEEDALSLSKYKNDTAYGIKTFKYDTSSTNYTDLGDSNGGVGFHYISNSTDYSTRLMSGGYSGTSSSYTPVVQFSKSTYLGNIAAPSTNTQAANKKYVDDKFALALPLSGGTLTGTLTLAADPTTNLGAATKQYVDTAVSGVSASIEVVRLI